MSLENFIREALREILLELPEVQSDYADNNSDAEDYDYLHLFKYTTTVEEKEVKDILQRMLNDAKRLSEIQDDCYGR